MMSTNGSMRFNDVKKNNGKSSFKIKQYIFSSLSNTRHQLILGFRYFTIFHSVKIEKVEFNVKYEHTS